MTLQLVTGKSWITVLIVAAAATACGGSAQTVSPLGPSSAASIGTLLDTGETHDVSGPAGGTGSAGGSGHHSDDDRDDGHRRGEEGGTANTPAPGAESHGVELRGLVANAAGTCPAVTFAIGTQSVVTSAATRFDDGACADIRNGRRVEVKGARQTDGTILASGVELEDADDVDDNEVKGIISGAAGTCPTRTFTLAGRTVATDARTIFEDGVCADVKDGVRAEVKGVLRADGTFLATSVELKDDAVDDDDDDRGEHRGPRDARGPLDGTVSNFVGACPTVVFQVKGVAVVTTAATTFVGGTCQTLRPGTKVIVTGTPVTDALLRPTLRASNIEIMRAR